MAFDQRSQNSQGRALDVLHALRLSWVNAEDPPPSARSSELCFTSPSGYTWLYQLRIGDGAKSYRATLRWAPLSRWPIISQPFLALSFASARGQGRGTNVP